MVNVATVSTALLLASAASASWIGDSELGRQRGGHGRRFQDVFDQQRLHGAVPSNWQDASVLSGPDTAARLEQRAPYPTVPAENMVSPPLVTTESRIRLDPRQAESDPNEGAAPPPPSPPIIPILTPADPSASAIIASLSTSASLALLSVSSSAAGALSSASASFQQNIAALSLKSSSDLSSVSASASSAVEAAVATNSAVSSSIAASASSAGASVASSSAADSASGAVASASSAVASANSAAESANRAAESAKSAAASASSAAVGASSSIDALQASLLRATSAMPSSTSAAPVVQPTASPTPADNGTFLVTSSQITAIVVGTFVGSAIVTLVVVCFIMSCRKKRAAKYAEKQGLETSRPPNSQDHDDSTGRAEGYWSRQESGAVPPSAVLSGPSASTRQAAASAPQRPTAAVHRPSLPTLVEEKPPVSASMDLSYSGRNAPTGSTVTKLSYSPTLVDGVPQQLEPVKLALSKRVSRGGSERTTAVRSGSQMSENGRHSSTLSTPAAQPIGSYFPPGSSRASSQALPNRPSFSRSPSSETLPALRKTIASPLTLNPPNAAFSAPKIPDLPPWTGSSKLKTASNVEIGPRQPGSQHENQEVRAQLPQLQRRSKQPEDPFTRAERQLSHIAFMVSQQHIEEQQRRDSRNAQPRSQVERNMNTTNITGSDTNAVAATVHPDTYIASPVPRRAVVSPLHRVSSFNESLDGISQSHLMPLDGPGWTEYPSSLSPPPPPPPRSPLRNSVALSAPMSQGQPPMPPVSPLSPSPNGSSGQDDNVTTAMLYPMHSSRSYIRNSFPASETYNVAGAVGLAQATAGLDIVGSTADGGDSSKGKETAVTVNRGDSNGSNSTTDSDTNVDRGRYTWLARNDDITQEAGNRRSVTPPKTAITSARGGGGPLMEPSPAEFASAASMRRSRARLTMDGDHFPTSLKLSSGPAREAQAEPQTPRFSLFPRTNSGGIGSPGVWSTANSDVSRMSPTGAGIGIARSGNQSPVGSSSKRGSRLGHKRNSSSQSTFNLGRRDRRSSSMQAVDK